MYSEEQKKRITESEQLPQQRQELEQTIAELTNQLQHAQGEIQQAAQTKRALQASEERFRMLIEQNTDAIVVLHEGIVAFVNPAACQLFHRSEDELHGRELGFPIVASDKAEVDIFDREGKQVVAEMRVADIFWERTPAQLATFRDVTERKMLANELEQRVEERTAMLQHTLHQLSTELAEREKTEKALLRRDAILEAIEFASHRFLKRQSVSQEIPLVLEYVGRATLVSRIALFQIHNETFIQIFSHAFTRTRSSGHLQGTSQDPPNTTELSAPGPRNFSRWKEQLRRGLSLHGDTRTFPPDEREVLEHELVSSLVVVPIFADQQWWGFIEFDEAQSGRLWMLAELEALRAAASMIGSAIQHGRVVEALRQSEERFRTIADFTYGWEYWVSPSGAYLYVSPSCERITGYKPAAFQQEPELFTQIVHPEDRADVAFHLNQEVSEAEQGDRQGEGEGEHTEKRFRIVTKEGDLRWIGHVSQPIYASDGTWLGRRGSNRDITEQVEAEEALKREQRLFIGGPVVVFKWRAGDSWDVAYVSPNVLQFGYQPEDFTSGAISYTTFIHPDDQDRIALEMRTYAEVEDTWFEQDYRIIQADGQIRWVYAFNRIIRANTGDITHYDGYILDITDRKQVEAALRQSEEQFRAFVERTDDLVVQLDSTSVITYVNHVVKRILGLSEEECIGKTLFDFMPDEDRKRIQNAFTSWLKNKASSVTFEGCMLHRSGVSHTMHWSMNMRYAPDGTLLTVNGIGRDFTERKRVEETLREREARYRTISELVSDFAYALWVEQDNTLVLEWVTDAFSRITGYTMQEVESQGGWYSLVYPDDVAVVRQSYDWLLSGQHSDEYEFRIVTGQGDIRWLRNHHRPVWDKSLGRIARIYGGMRDVTEWKQAMEAMQESEQKFHCFFEQSQDGLVLMNDHGYIVECNHRAEVIWGQSHLDVMGLTLWDVLFEAIPDQQKQAHAYEEMKAHFEQQMQADHAVRQEWVVQEICAGDGEHKVVESMVFPIETEHGTLMGGVMRVRSARHVDGA